MLTLSYGFKKPQTGDKGSVFWPALEQDIQQLNDHNHDGANSTKLTAKSIVGVSGALLAAAWVATSGGTYRAQVTTPAGVAFNDYGLIFRITSSGHVIYPTVEKIDATNFYVYSNDNTIGLTYLFLV